MRPGCAQDIQPRRHMLPRRNRILQPGVGLVNRETVQRRLIEVVQHLANDTSPLQADGVEFGLLRSLLHQAIHVVLRRFQVEESRLSARLGKPGRARRQRPIQRYAGSRE